MQLRRRQHLEAGASWPACFWTWWIAQIGPSTTRRVLAKTTRRWLIFCSQIIPEPRCINLIQQGVEKGRYKDATDVYTDLSLVFWNALFYNEAGSQIADDATTLKVCFFWRFCSFSMSSVEPIRDRVEKTNSASDSPFISTAVFCTEGTQSSGGRNEARA